MDCRRSPTVPAEVDPPLPNAQKMMLLTPLTGRMPSKRRVKTMMWCLRKGQKLKRKTQSCSRKMDVGS